MKLIPNLKANFAGAVAVLGLASTLIAGCAGGSLTTREKALESALSAAPRQAVSLVRLCVIQGPAQQSARLSDSEQAR